MIAAWADFAADDSVDVAILTGAGDEAFCAGADLKAYIPPIIAGGRPDDVREIVELGLNGFTRGMHRIPKPIIGAVNGWALAGGFETALACDIRIASERAMFGSFEARRGFHHGDGGLVRWSTPAASASPCTCCSPPSRSTPAQALEWNLVSKVVPHESLMEEAETVARQILRNSQRAVRSAKQTILDVVGQPLDQQLRTEAWNAYMRRPRGDQGDAGALLREDRPWTGRGPRDRALMAGAPKPRALVTGAARGIGAAIAERLRADGMEVTTLDRAEGCDLTVDLVADELPDLAEIDVCVSNAAITDTIAPPTA